MIVVTHVAGPVENIVGGKTRQCCARCGYDLRYLPAVNDETVDTTFVSCDELGIGARR